MISREHLGWVPAGVQSRAQPHGHRAKAAAVQLEGLLLIGMHRPRRGYNGDLLTLLRSHTDVCMENILQTSVFAQESGAVTIPGDVQGLWRCGSWGQG